MCAVVNEPPADVIAVRRVSAAESWEIIMGQWLSNLYQPSVRFEEPRFLELPEHVRQTKVLQTPYQQHPVSVTFQPFYGLLMHGSMRTTTKP